MPRSRRARPRNWRTGCDSNNSPRNTPLSRLIRATCGRCFRKLPRFAPKGYKANSESPTGYAFKTGEPIISNHLESESRFRTPALLAEHGIKRAINALIQTDGERFGVLEVDSPVERRFTEADLVFVEGFANLLGVALERQRTEEALKQQEILLQEALRHQEFLTKEISHRVKNSLSMVASMLSMQSRATVDPGLQRGARRRPNARTDHCQDA
jgi:GAF domain-containing protein